MSGLVFREIENGKKRIGNAMKKGDFSTTWEELGKSLRVLRPMRGKYGRKREETVLFTL